MIADRLQELIDSKADMKSAIREKGVEVEGGLTSYASAIRKIQTGSGSGDDIDWNDVRFGGSKSIPLKPNELYKCGDMDYMFTSCNSWVLHSNGFDLSQVDCRFATSFDGIFNNCNLNDHDIFTNWDTSNVVSMKKAFEGSMFINMDSLSHWDTSNVRSMYRCFKNASIDTIPNWDYSNVSEFYEFLQGSTDITSIPRISMKSLQDEYQWILMSVGSGGIYENFNKLVYIGGFIDLKAKITHHFVSHCPNLTVESLTNIIRDIYDWNTNPDNEDINNYYPGLDKSPVLDFGLDHLRKLTDEQIAVAINKGWTLV